MLHLQQRIDTLYSALEKLRSIGEDVDASLYDMPFDDPDDPKASLWWQKNDVQVLCRFSEIIQNATDFVQNAINNLETN